MRMCLRVSLAAVVSIHVRFSVLQSLEMERQGGLLPLPPLTSQLTLYELCTQFVGDRVSAYLDELVNLPGHILQVRPFLGPRQNE